MSFPPLNAPPLLYRYIKRLALPGEISVRLCLAGLEADDKFLVVIYSAVKQLQDLLGFTFSFPTRIEGKWRHLHLPELQLVTLIVISTKLIFSLDGVKRYPTSSQEPAAQVMDWKFWAQTQRHFDNRDVSRGKIGKGKEILVSEKDVFGMTLDQLDEYMDWYENGWLDKGKGTDTHSFPFLR